MINPENFPVDADEMTEWLNAHKTARGLSWQKIADESGINFGTISTFGGGTYTGNKENIARKIFKYRQTVEARDDQAASLPQDPGFLNTITGDRIEGILVAAHMGGMALGALGPGLGKTYVAREYANRASNVFIATMRPTTKGLPGMIGTVLGALGSSARTGGWTRMMSAEVMNAVRGRKALLVIDEANHLDLDAIEELRSWHDETGVGICLLGNEELYTRIYGGGGRSHAYGRLKSRIGSSVVQDLPDQADVDVFLDGWNITNAPMRKLLMDVGMRPSAGGLREIKQIIVAATLMAEENDHPITLGDLRAARDGRAVKHIRIAA
jgi:hypothetical protein